MTVLLIDDDEDDQDIFREAAATVVPEIECLTARDGEEGLRLLRSLSALPMYIFLDVNMPRMDGREFLKRVKADPALRAIPVVIYTTTKHKSELGEYFKLGAGSFITKPSEFSLLVSYLKSILIKT